MKATGTIQIPVRRHRASVAAMAVAVILHSSIGLLQVVRTISSDEGRVVADPTVGGLGPVVGGFAPLAEDWGFVLTSDTAQVLGTGPVSRRWTSSDRTRSDGKV